MSLSQQLEMEDNLKLQVPTPVLKQRNALCAGCKFKGDNNFCQVNFQWLPEFAKFRYNACPNDLWTYG